MLPVVGVGVSGLLDAGAGVGEFGSEFRSKSSSGSGLDCTIPGALGVPGSGSLPGVVGPGARFLLICKVPGGEGGDSRRRGRL